MAKDGNFFWYDLMTTDVPAAVQFYKKVVGWNDEAFPGSEMGYVVLKAGDRGVGGIMPVQNAQQPPAWLGYIRSADVDTDAKAAQAAGAKLWKGPDDIPGGVGRFAVLSDPNNAPYMLFKPNGPDMDALAPMTPGTIGWNEYIGDDWQKAFDYYSGLYGWTKGEAVDMGEMGVYQIVEKDGQMIAGMMNRPPEIPVSHWGFYFAVEGIDAARKRVVDAGGTITMEPMEVPGGQWVLSGQDPQGAHFGLVSDTK
ncbi:VOC family protein [Salmonella enterica subsp. enterica]|nr:VOC family protein [Salmonella enterica subsp. enterica]MIL09716.1 VOC family protein [Salmonella enterica subsp. enterica serovar Enteritidis]